MASFLCELKKRKHEAEEEQKGNSRYTTIEKKVTGKEGRETVRWVDPRNETGR